MSMKVGNPIDIAVSGLQAQSRRMGVISNNIANANTSRTAEGTPFRRQDILLRAADEPLSGVADAQVVADTSSDFKKIYQPGHPDAGEDGMVLMPNVEVPREIMHLVAASRAYQANASVLKRYQEISNATLELLR